jgi:pyruvate formate lyase activating enzyme
LVESGDTEADVEGGMAKSFTLDRLTEVRDDLVQTHSSGKLVCVACAHRCKIGAEKRGICQLRFNDGQGLRVPWGYVSGLAVDPIEKKPFFHVRPGASALSFGMLGCDFHCAFCQNWYSSQTYRDSRASTRAQSISAQSMVDVASSRGCQIITSTYNEPLITAEWAHEIFSIAKAHGLLNGFVSNGHGTVEVIDYLQPVIDLFKVDLKAFRPASYRQLGGKLEAVTESISALHQRQIWVEVVTLLVPGFNDDPAELRDMAEFIAGVSVDIPWHVTAFHPDYEMTDRGPTPVSMLVKAREIGFSAGLKHVYAGNVPGALERGEDTMCPECKAVLVERRGFMVLGNRIGSDGACPDCQTAVAGVWS